MPIARERGERADVKVEEIKRRKRGPGRGRSKGPSYNRAAIVGQTLEKKLIKGIDRTIRYLKKTAQQMPKRSGGRLEMLERILNLTLEQAAYIASDEQDIYDRKWRAWDRGGRKGREPRLDSRRSNAHWREVLELSKGILREYPKSRNADQISFNAALALQFLGQEKLAAREFSRLIKRYPKSPIAGDAYFSLGDYYFDRNDFRTAMSNYKLAIKYRRSKRYGWALFKLGWCYYNLGRFESSLKFWQMTVAHSDRMGGKKGLRLKEEAMRDIVFAYAELKQIEEAIRFYRRHSGEEYIAKFLKLLGETYADQGFFKQSVQVWKKLLDLYPTSGEAFDGQKEIVALTYEQRDYKDLWVELERLAKGYHRRSRWAAKNDKYKVAEAQKDIYKLMLYYPKVIHKEAQKGNDKRRYFEARKGYRLFLRQYPKSRDVAEIKEYLGDIEYFHNNFREAGQIYLEIAMLGKNKAVIYDEKGRPKRNIHRRSAQNMLDAYNKEFLPELKNLLKTKPDFNKPPRALSVRAKNFIKGCSYYVKWYPKDQKTVKNCETFISEIYYRGRDRKMAKRYLWLLATKYPNTKEGNSAVENLIPLYDGDEKGMISVARKLLSIPAYQRGSIGKKLRDLLRGVELDNIANEKDILKRAKLYEAQARQNPRDKDADKLWNNAAADYLKAGYIPGALLAFGMIVKSYPKSVAFPTALLQLGKIYDSRMDFGQASEFYMLYASKYPKTKESPGAMERACILAIALDSSQAISICTQFARRYRAGGPLALEKLIELLWRKRRLADMAKVIQNEYLSRFKLSANQQILAYYKIYDGYNQQGAQAARASNAILQIFQKSGGSASGEALRYVGEIVFKSVQPLFKRYLTLRLRGGTVDTLQGSIQQISNSLVQLEQAYGQVFATKDSYWGVASFYQLAFAYEAFGNQLKNPPGIQGAKPADVKAQLQASVDEVMAKAKDLYSTGLQTARQFTVYNEWTPQIFNALNRLVKRKLTFEEWIISPDFASSEIPSVVRSGL